MALAFWRISRHIHAAATDSLKRFAALNDHVQESLSGVRTAARARAWKQRSAHAVRRTGRRAPPTPAWTAQKWEAAYEPAVGLTLTAASVLTLGLGGYLVWHGQLTIGALTSFTHVPGPADLADVRGRLGAVADRARHAPAWRACSRCSTRR